MKEKMKKLLCIARLTSILTLVLLATGCEEKLDGDVMATTFSMIIVDENGSNLLDPRNPDNIIERVEMEVVRSDRKIIPIQWFDEDGGNASLWMVMPGINKDNPGCFDYDSNNYCLMVGYWNSEALWETSFKIRIPEYGIECSVTGGRRSSSKGTHVAWQVDGEDCRYFQYTNKNGRLFTADYKLTLPIQQPEAS